MKKKGSRRKRSRALMALTVIAISLLVTLVVCEILVRVFFGDVQEVDRLAVYNTFPFSIEHTRTRRYKPKLRVQQTTLYDGKVEFQHQFSTNNFGFVDDVDYHPARKKGGKSLLALVGDSFTAGTGASPWVPRLRKNLRRRSRPVDVINLGVAGAGLQTFEQLLGEVAESFSLDAVLIIAIGNDFYRPPMRSLEVDNLLYFCPDFEKNRVCKKRTPLGTLAPRDATDDQLQRAVQRVAEIRARRVARRQGRGMLARALSFSRLFRLCYDVYHDNPLVGMVNSKQKVHEVLKGKMVKKSFEALGRMRASFAGKKMIFVHLPEKTDVAAGRYLLDIEARVRALGLEYVPALKRCSWSSQMFYQRDAHPNPKGYATIERCVREIIAERFPQMKLLSKAEPAAASGV